MSYLPILKLAHTKKKNKVIKKSALILLTIGCLLLAACNGDAMVKCQEKHSYDTCFYALNR